MNYIHFFDKTHLKNSHFHIFWKNLSFFILSPISVMSKNLGGNKTAPRLVTLQHFFTSKFTKPVFITKNLHIRMTCKASELFCLAALRNFFCKLHTFSIAALSLKEMWILFETNGNHYEIKWVCLLDQKLSTNICVKKQKHIKSEGCIETTSINQHQLHLVKVKNFQIKMFCWSIWTVIISMKSNWPPLQMNYSFYCWNR